MIEISRDDDYVKRWVLGRVSAADVLELLASAPSVLAFFSRASSAASIPALDRVGRPWAKGAAWRVTSSMLRSRCFAIMSCASFNSRLLKRVAAWSIDMVGAVRRGAGVFMLGIVSALDREEGYPTGGRGVLSSYSDRLPSDICFHSAVYSILYVILELHKTRLPGRPPPARPPHRSTSISIAVMFGDDSARELRRRLGEQSQEGYSHPPLSIPRRLPNAACHSQPCSGTSKSKRRHFD